MALIPMRKQEVARQSYDPFRSFRDEFDRLFDNFMPSLSQGPSATMNQLTDVRINVSETDKEIRIRAELPGVEDKDIDLQLTQDVLTLRGEKRLEHVESDHNYHLVESSYGNFARSIRLPFEASADAVTAKFKNGILTVSIAKPEKPKLESAKIEVQSE